MLCGSTEQVSREHRLKAAALRRIFKDGQLLIGRGSDPVSEMRQLQSSASRRLKFSVPLCHECNTARTQAADRAFDRFEILATRLESEGLPPREAIAQFDGSEKDLFRYFAKILCLHVAEAGAPVPSRLREFAVGRSDRNCVWADVSTDAEALRLRTSGLNKYAAHGGLVVTRSCAIARLPRVSSSLTFGTVCVAFFFYLTESEALEWAHCGLKELRELLQS